MPAWLQAIVLGVVQGLTEFIPVSSSGHLVLVPYLAGWGNPGLAFNVAMHLGTAAAVVVYFRRELLAMAAGMLGQGGADGKLYRKVALLVVVGSIPVAVAGVLFEDQVAEVFESPLIASVLLLVTAALLVGGERLRDCRVRKAGDTARPRPSDDRPAAWQGDWRGSIAVDQSPAPTLPLGSDSSDPLGRTLDRIGLRQVVVIGLFQCLALLPGISRSGSTISAAMGSGVTREAATRFSFLLSLPPLLGAFVLSLGDLSEPGPYSGAAIAGGVLASFVAGYLAIRFLVRLVSSDRLTGFARYCVFAAVIGIIGYQFLGPASSV